MNANADKALPNKFIVAGLVVKQVADDTGKPRKVREVRASLQHYANGVPINTSVQAMTRAFRPSGDPERVLWVAVVKYPNINVNTRVKLTVEAFERGSADAIASVDFDLLLAPPHFDPPKMDWPDSDGYTLSGDEKSYFVTFGSTDLPITAATVSGVPADNAEWSVADDTWWAAFSNLGATPGNKSITISNADGDKDRPIVVPA
jgi:hypothetical protein